VKKEIKMVKRTVTILMILLLAVSMLFGCTQATTTPAATTANGTTAATTAGTTGTTAKAAPTNITYFTWEASEKTNPIWAEMERDLNIKVEVRVLPDTGGADKEVALDIVEMSGDTMDFRIITEAAPATRVEKGFALALDDLIKKYNVDMTKLFGSFAELVKFKGKYYGIPCRANIGMYFYNKDLFDAAGIAYPKDGWTWDEYMALAKQLSKGSGADQIFGTCTNAHPGMWMRPAIMFGVSPFTADGKANFNNPIMVQSLKDYYEMGVNGLKPSFVSMRSRNSYVSVEFLSGKCAMAAGFGYILRDMRIPAQFPFNFKAGIVNPPVLKKGDPVATDGGVQFLAINPSSKNIDASFQAMVYYMEKGAKYVAALNVPPIANPSDEVLAAFVKGTPISKEDGAKFFNKDLKIYNSSPWGNFPNGVAYQAILNEEAEKYLTGGQDLTTTTNNIMTRAAAVLK
jgi:multiple sugar transport system substrate-binding protein